MNRFNNKNFKKVILWTSIASLISLIAKNYGIFEMISMTEDIYNAIIEKILYILVLVGILTNQDQEGDDS